MIKKNAVVPKSLRMGGGFAVTDRELGQFELEQTQRNLAECWFHRAAAQKQKCSIIPHFVDRHHSRLQWSWKWMKLRNPKRLLKSNCKGVSECYSMQLQEEPILIGSHAWIRVVNCTSINPIMVQIEPVTGKNSGHYWWIALKNINIQENSLSPGFGNTLTTEYHHRLWRD